MKWEDYAVEFRGDGSLRDIYVLESSLADWQILLDFLHSSDYKLRYLWGAPENLPKNAVEVFGRESEDKGLLCVESGELSLNCHFFYNDEIEFDLLPNEVTDEERAEAIFDFMRQLGRTLNKDVILTPENERSMPIFKFSPATQELEYFPVMLNLFGLEFWKKKSNR